MIVSVLQLFVYSNEKLNQNLEDIIEAQAQFVAALVDRNKLLSKRHNFFLRGLHLMVDLVDFRRKELLESFRNIWHFLEHLRNPIGLF